MNTVYVISKCGKPLMPTHSLNARILLKNKKARVVKREPFTIKLLYDTTTYTQPLTLGVDTGSAKLAAAVSTETGEVIYLSEVEIRNDISKKMKQRASYRRTRRTRKTRYRKARWLNRKNSIKKDRFSPTMRSKFDSHQKEINFVKSILPISNTFIETATFDPHAMKNPDVLKDKSLYQRGEKYQFSNTKAYVFSRDGYACQHCDAKNTELQAHHLIERSKGGSDAPSNLITLCKKCHKKHHSGKITLEATGKRNTLKHATQMNSIRVQILRRNPNATETFGYITKENRYMMGLPKEHFYDAVAIAFHDNIFVNGLISYSIKSYLYRKKSVAKGDYQQTKGKHSEKRIPTGKVHGFRKFDKVSYKNDEYFIKGKRTSGYMDLMKIDGKRIQFSPTPKASLMKRISARKSTLIQREIIA